MECLTLSHITDMTPFIFLFTQKIKPLAWKRRRDESSTAPPLSRSPYPVEIYYLHTLWFTEPIVTIIDNVTCFNKRALADLISACLCHSSWFYSAAVDAKRLAHSLLSTIYGARKTSYNKRPQLVYGSSINKLVILLWTTEHIDHVGLRQR